jgi:hypothetical protein
LDLDSLQSARRVRPELFPSRASVCVPFVLLRTAAAADMTDGCSTHAMLTFDRHAFFDALLKATRFASITIVTVDNAAITEITSILFLSQNASLEEALASFTGGHAVMCTGRFVQTHTATGSRDR